MEKAPNKLFYPFSTLGLFFSDSSHHASVHPFLGTLLDLVSPFSVQLALFFKFGTFHTTIY